MNPNPHIGPQIPPIRLRNQRNKLGKWITYLYELPDEKHVEFHPKLPLIFSKLWLQNSGGFGEFSALTTTNRTLRFSSANSGGFLAGPFDIEGINSTTIEVCHPLYGGLHGHKLKKNPKNVYFATHLQTLTFQTNHFTSSPILKVLLTRIHLKVLQLLSIVLANTKTNSRLDILSNSYLDFPRSRLAIFIWISPILKFSTHYSKSFLVRFLSLIIHSWRRGRSLVIKIQIFIKC